ncbi:hypothetical protein ACLMJK_008078 [Lecanora helva]
MPHATNPADIANDENDDVLISQLINANSGDGNDLQTSLDFQRDLDPGEKAEDAVDFGDLSDDDLADDEEINNTQAFESGELEHGDKNSARFEPFMQDEGLASLANRDNTEDDGMDDLFGDDHSSQVGDYSHTAQEEEQNDPEVLFSNEDQNLRLARELRTIEYSSDARKQASSQYAPQDSKDIPLSREQQLQMELFQMSRHGLERLPAPPENQEELLASLWPKFERDTIPKFMNLLPPKKARYVGKTVPRPPKPVHPTKINLEVARDEEKSFRTWPSSTRRSLEDTQTSNLVSIEQDIVDDNSSEDHVDTESDFENNTVGGISWQDLQIACEDWDAISIAQSFGSEETECHNSSLLGADAYGNTGQYSHAEDGMPLAKRRKLETPSASLLKPPQFSLFPLHDPEHETSRIAQKICLDLNDPEILLDHAQAGTSHRNVSNRQYFMKVEQGAFAETISQRYNISNDEAYDMLKENHQSKVRSMLGNAPVEHSVPAVRLQWPFYKTKLDKQHARAFHRPVLKVKRDEHIPFAKPKFSKRKHLKGKPTQSLFRSSSDLSLGDNSNVLLLEYSEEYPTMLSNVGMGNRVINYYRRKAMEDTSRPRLDIGETAVLLPQDKSPFSIFGHVDPGQTMPALYNSMYRAPIFKQTPKNTDFLVTKTTTGERGSAWFLRNIENLYTVGQEFPSVDVPGPHSRKVTTASKNRLKMVSYRLIRKSETNRINVNEVTSHFADTTDMQNRQKMKEFMQFNKEHKEWQMRHGESIPDEDTVRSMVKPEDVCLLESMQVGQQHLQDAGFSKEDDDSEVDDAKEGQSIEQQLAPWYTSRNFLHATQGKAMLALHGEGDPSGRGEAFSFIKTSMKGGFKAAEASAIEKIRAKQMKDSSGHAYNVQEQQKSYEQSIRRIWEAQKRSLSSTYEQSGFDIDEDPLEEASSDAFRARTPRSETQTPVNVRRRDDETMSQYTQHSSGSQVGKILKISRNVSDANGGIVVRTETIQDPKVIRQYLKRKNQEEEETLEVTELTRTGDPEKDKRREQRMKQELFRLQKNKERRLAREKGKVHFDGVADSAGSPSSLAAKTAGTQRKCANCGQVGHIKTNKKLCPMLNGTMKPEEGFNNSAFTMGTSNP